MAPPGDKNMHEDHGISSVLIFWVVKKVVSLELEKSATITNQDRTKVTTTRLLMLPAGSNQWLAAESSSLSSKQSVQGSSMFRVKMWTEMEQLFKSKGCSIKNAIEVQIRNFKESIFWLKNPQAIIEY